jgi:hypothetical protein
VKVRLSKMAKARLWIGDSCSFPILSGGPTLPATRAELNELVPFALRVRSSLAGWLRYRDANGYHRSHSFFPFNFWNSGF